MKQSIASLNREEFGIHGRRFVEERRTNFFDLPPEERADTYERVAQRAGVENFFDLPPEERARAYDRR